MLDPARLVFIDETAVSTNMVRLRGRAPRGVRVIGAVPLGRWETITFVAALRHNKMVAPMVVEGAMTGEMFLAYVENCLVPTLRRNDIVVMDNCRVHLGTGIGRAIETVGATLRYLPKYSPDLNPIEMPYSKFKTFLRKVAARTIPSLNRAIRSFIPQLSPQECANYFRHAGYVNRSEFSAPEVLCRHVISTKVAARLTRAIASSGEAPKLIEASSGRTRDLASEKICPLIRAKWLLLSHSEVMI